MIRSTISTLFVAMLALGAVCGPAAAKSASNHARPIAIRMVVVTAFEIGKDTGDMAGELQNWASTIRRRCPSPVATGCCVMIRRAACW